MCHFLVTEFGSDTAKFGSDALNFGSDAANFGSDVKIAKFSIFFVIIGKFLPITTASQHQVLQLESKFLII